MLTDDVKGFVSEQCGNPAIGIAPVDDLSPREIAALENVNRIMAAHTPRQSPDTPIFQPRDFLDNAE